MSGYMSIIRVHNLMKRTGCLLVVKYGAWILLLFNLMLFLFISDAPLNLWTIALGIWVFLSSSVSVTLLPFFYQRFLGRWSYWLLLLGIHPLDFIVLQNISQNLILRGLMQLTLLFIGWAAIVSIGIQLVKHDFGLKLIAWLSLLFMFAWVAMAAQGNYINSVMSFAWTDEPNFVKWVNGLLMAASIIILLGITSFLWHTALILWKEIVDPSPRRRTAKTLKK